LPKPYRTRLLPGEDVEVVACNKLDIILDSGVIFLSRTHEISEENHLRATDRDASYLKKMTIPEVNTRQRVAPPGAFGL